MRLLLFTFLLSALSFGQDRNGISYQALIINPNVEQLPGQDNDHSPLTNTDICLQFHIINSSGNYEYSESQSVTTDAFGMVNLVIGTGTPIGAITWDAVAWSAEAKSLKVDLDITGACTSFTELSNQQLTSVPFALYSPSSNVPGPKGDPGDPGEDGDSAYKVWLDEGNTGTEQEFLDSLKGTDGTPGADGDSAYQVWLDAGNTGTEQEFLDSLKGADGDPGEGTEGKSAYDIWIELGNTGTEQDFIDSLVGPQGEPGQDANSNFSGSSFSNINSTSVSKLNTVLENGYSNQLSISDTGIVVIGDVYYDIEEVIDIGRVSVFDFDGVNFKNILNSSGTEFLSMLNPNETIRRFGSNIAISGNGEKLLIGHQIKNTLTNTTDTSLKFLGINTTNNSLFLLKDIDELIGGNRYRLNEDATKLFYQIGSQGFFTYLIDDNNNFNQESSYDYTALGGNSNQNFMDISDDFSTAIVTNSSGSGGVFGNINGAGLAYVLQKTGNTWIQKGQVLTGLLEYEAFGTTASISADGNTIAVATNKGSNYNSPQTSSFTTHIYKFTNNQWVQKGNPITLRFSPVYNGLKLSNNGDFLIIASSLKDHLNMPPDSVYFFSFSDGDWSQLGSGIEFNGIENIDSSNGNLIVIDELNISYQNGSYNSIYELKAKKIY